MIRRGSSEKVHPPAGEQPVCLVARRGASPFRGGFQVGRSLNIKLPAVGGFPLINVVVVTMMMMMMMMMMIMMMMMMMLVMMTLCFILIFDVSL